MLNLKKKQESQVAPLKQKQRSDEAAKRLQDGKQCIKAQKGQIQQKIKQEAECFRQWKASREKELLQLRKEGRRNEHERHKLQALNQFQKMVLQRKTEAAIATKRLKELIGVHKCAALDNRGQYKSFHGNTLNVQRNEKTLQRWIDLELEAMVNAHAARFEYEKQSQVQTAFAEELPLVKQVDQFSSDGLSPPQGKSENFRVSSMSPNARSARVVSPVNMLTTSSNAIVAMALQLSEKEERERGFTAGGHWNLLRSLGGAKTLLQYMFYAATDARCNILQI
ncbi:unnamed protein product [Ilex paraguariensis]|uniref:Uncharacterized protein n=1 Tax=Ilex paraguariensis TaxID=185542 RepID=A0ABC8SW58_9AQUA